MNSLITKFLHVLPVKPKEITVKKEFGKDVWSSMQPKLNEQFRIDNPQRNEIEGAVRIK